MRVKVEKTEGANYALAASFPHPNTNTAAANWRHTLKGPPHFLL